MIDRVARFVLTALLGLACALIAVPLAHPNPGPIFTDGFEEPADYCTSVAGDPLVAPVGWQSSIKSWTQAFTWPNGQNVPTYPDSGGSPVPIYVNRYGYTAIVFVPLENQSVSLTWDQPQASALTGYLSPSPGRLFFSLSPCPGDFRPAFNGDPDGFLQTGCRKGPSQFGGLTWHTFANPSDVNACRLVAGQVYYLNAIAADPIDGLQDDESTCFNPMKTRCEVGAKQGPN